MLVEEIQKCIKDTQMVRQLESGKFKLRFTERLRCYL